MTRVPATWCCFMMPFGGSELLPTCFTHMIREDPPKKPPKTGCKRWKKRWRPLWCSHHSAFVKLPPPISYKIATFKGLVAANGQGLQHVPFFLLLLRSLTLFFWLRRIYLACCDSALCTRGFRWWFRSPTSRPWYHPSECWRPQNDGFENQTVCKFGKVAAQVSLIRDRMVKVLILAGAYCWRSVEPSFSFDEFSPLKLPAKKHHADPWFVKIEDTETKAVKPVPRRRFGKKRRWPSCIHWEFEGSYQPQDNKNQPPAAFDYGGEAARMQLDASITFLKVTS